MSCMSEELQEQADPMAQPRCKGLAPVKELVKELWTSLTMSNLVADAG